MNKRGMLKKFLILLFLLVIGIYLIRLYENSILAWLESYPVLWAIFEHMRLQIKEKTVLGLGYLTFTANLFFIYFPIEVAAVYYFTLGHSPILIFAMLIASTVVSQFFNYLVGLMLGQHVFKLFFSDHTDKMQSHSEKWGVWMLVLFSTVPFLPLSWISVFLGSMKYKIRHFLMWVSLTTFAKYLVVYLFSEWVQNAMSGIVKIIPILGYFT